MNIRKSQMEVNRKAFFDTISFKSLFSSAKEKLFADNMFKNLANFYFRFSELF